jgi:hypothetical protein
LSRRHRRDPEAVELRTFRVVCSRGHGEVEVARFRVPADPGERRRRIEAEAEPYPFPVLAMNQLVTVDKMAGEEYARDGWNRAKPLWKCPQPRCGLDPSITARQADEIVDSYMRHGRLVVDLLPLSRTLSTQ